MTGTLTKHKRKNGRQSWGFWFHAGWDETGKRIQKTKSGFDTRDEARKALDAAIEEFQNRFGSGPTAQTRDMRTVSEYLPYWLKENAAVRCSPKTLERYRDFARYIERQLGPIRLVDLKTAALQGCVNRLKVSGGAASKAYPDGKPLAARTVRHIASMLYSVLADAERLEHIPVNPMAGKKIKLPKRIKAKPAVVDPEKLAELFRTAKGTRLYPFVVVAAASGCRRGELLALTWNNLDFTTGMVRVSKSLEQTKAGLRVKGTKSGEERSFEIDEFALGVLEEHRQQQSQDRELFGRDYQRNGLVFCQPNGAYYSPDRVGARVKELMFKVGLTGVSLHSLRHSNASVMLSAGVPLPVVSERLGHQDQNITLAIYSHVLPTDRKAASRAWHNALAEVIAQDRTQNSVAPKQMLGNARKKAVND